MHEGFVFLDATKVTDRGVGSMLKRCTHLRILRLSALNWEACPEIDESELNLEILELASNHINDEDASFILRLCPELLELDLSGCAHISDDTLKVSIAHHSDYIVCILNLCALDRFSERAV